MNYLETGLPHTEFYPRKTQFSPPRFIPLCNLGRKYLGLEPLTRRELEGLIKRLSGPKKPTTDHEEQCVQMRQATPRGTGRFVGQKRMSTIEIEKMVERLHSSRSVRDYPFDDESVTGSDIINMTDRTDDSSDSDNDVFYENDADVIKEANDVENSQIQQQRSAMSTSESEAACLYKRGGMMSLVRKEYAKTRMQKPTMENRPPDIPKLKLDFRPRSSVSFARDTSLLEKRMKYRDGPDRNVKRSNTVCSYVAMRPEVKRVKPCPIYAYNKSDCATLPKSDKMDEKSVAESIKSCFSKSNKYMEPELTRPPPSRVDYTQIAIKDGEKCVKSESTRATCTAASGAQEMKSATPRSLNKMESKPDTNISPRQRLSKIDSNKSRRYAVFNCDELLIDRVATYNRTPRIGSK